MIRIIGIALMVVFAGYLAAAGAAPEFRKQVLDSPEGRIFWEWGHAEWQDLDGDGLADLAVASVLNQIYIYRQGPDGFPSKPTQMWKLPDGTAWFRVGEADADGKREILVGCTEGIASYRQKGKLFSPQPVWRVSEKQAFGRNDRPMFNAVQTKRIEKRVPVVHPDYVQWFQLDGTGLKPGPKEKLEVATTLASWSYLRAIAGGPETFGIAIRTTGKTKASSDVSAADRFLEDLRKSYTSRKDIEHCMVERKDINGDGREDAALCLTNKDLEPRTTWYIYLRRPDGNLPREPDQTMRTKGWPLSTDRSNALDAFIDVNGDGKLDLVMREMKHSLTTIGGFLKSVLSHGMEWTFTIRFYDDKKGFSLRPDFRMDIPTRFLGWGSVTLDGDFNGDRRPDFLVRTGDGQYCVYLSTASGELYQSKPELQFEVPVHSWNRSVRDLNGDGICDLAAPDDDEGHMIVFLSQSSTKKGDK